jgi:hypothetical protein
VQRQNLSLAVSGQGLALGGRVRLSIQPHLDHVQFVVMDETVGAILAVHLMIKDGRPSRSCMHGGYLCGRLGAVYATLESDLGASLFQ